MIKKTITYVDYDGNQRTEDFFFHLNEAELTEMRLSKLGGLEIFLERIIKEQNAPEIIKNIKEIILRAYGQKSDDGKYFMKTPELAKAFECSEAYPVLFMDVCQSPDTANEFFLGILPEKIRASVAANSADISKNAQN